MFPDTMNFTDPYYTTSNPTGDPLDPTGESYNTISPNDPAYIAMSAGNVPQSGYSGADFSDFFSPNKPPVSTGGAASNSPAQQNTSGTGLLGWLGLANNVANTAANAARTGATTRPGVTTKQSTLGSFGTVTTTTLLVIVAVFVVVVYMLRKS